MTTSALAAATLSLLVNNVPFTGVYLHDSKPPCEVTRDRASAWKKQGVLAVESRVGDWCAVGAVMNGYWVAEQWRRSPSGHRSEGWAVTIPLPKTTTPKPLKVSPWGLDVLDPAIGSRIQFRRSHQPLSQHHLQTLDLVKKEGRRPELSAPTTSSQAGLLVQRMHDGGLVVSGSDAAVGSYSVTIDRAQGVH